ncbi:MAG: DUF998 domain-containing protein [Candidatus Undinarchaeales archaeon]|jgi:hypothetical membrane protein|nr:DUF998 domain-containing protein [Candidatus Undinarchaeales archaeon]MDP7492554.1 DUF998 domain-containing protein [Candidatus Undinarchaeales archaeon]
MPRRPLVNVRLAGYCGIAAFAVAFICILFATNASPWFSWTETWLSDLGGRDGEAVTLFGPFTAAHLFNNGVMLASLLGIGLVGGLWGFPGLDTPWGKRGLVLLVLDMVALFGVGLFPISLGVRHDYAAVLFFVLIPASLLALAKGLNDSGEDGHARTMGVLGAIALVTVPLIELLPQPWGNNALIETIPSLALGIASLVSGRWLLVLDD